MSVAWVRRASLAAAVTAMVALGASIVASVMMPAAEPASASDLIWFGSFLSFPLAGLLILWHRPFNTVGWIFVVVGLAQAIAATTGVVFQVSLTTDPTGQQAAVVLLVGYVALTVAWVLATTYPLLLFPDGRLPSRRWLWVMRANTLCLALAVLSLVVKPGEFVADDPVNPLGVSALGAVPGWVLTGALIGCLLVSFIAGISLVVRWHRGSEEVRGRLAWLALAVVVVAVVLTVEQVVSPWAPDWVGAIAESVWVAALPVATTVALLRSGLFDVEAVLDRSLVYIILTGLVILTYIGTATVVSSLTGLDAGNGAGLLAAALVVVLMSPAQNVTQRAIDRFLYGDRSQPYALLSGFAAELGRTTGDEDLLQTVTRSIAQSLRVPYVAVVAGEEVEVPDDTDAFPLISHGRQEGVLLVGRRSGGRGFDAKETRLLVDLARQIAVERRALRLATDLQDSRERIVRGREEERLRVRRDLHDGVGPTLAAASLQCDALRDRWPIADPQAAVLLGQVKSEISQCVLDIRRVIDGLRPPALDDLGLVGVVREHAASLSAAGLGVRVDCPREMRLTSAAVEVAAYRIVTEAMTNVVRHAAASRCAVALRCTDGWLDVEVDDDGVGMNEPHREGIGLASMRERAAELGGSFTVASQPGLGARITARLPLPAHTPP